MTPPLSPTLPPHKSLSQPLSSPPWGHDRTWYWRGWRIHYTYLRPRRSPGGTPLVLIHGFGAALGHWRHNFEAWSEAHPVYALDLLGFGRSQKAGANYNPAFFAELIQDFCDTFVQRPAILVGNSLGSVISLLTAHHAPDRVRGLVLINLPDASVLSRRSVPPTASAPPPPIIRALQFLATFIFTSPLVINPLLAIVSRPRFLYSALRNAYADPRWVDDELKALIREPTQDHHAALALRCLTRGMGQTHPSDRARWILPQLEIPVLLLWGKDDRLVPPQLEIPVLLLWGKDDRLVPPQLGPRCAALNPRIELVELERAGHCPQDECGDRLNGIVLDWIQKNEIN